jgi:hypothetical protein
MRPLFLTGDPGSRTLLAASAGGPRVALAAPRARRTHAERAMTAAARYLRNAFRSRTESPSGPAGHRSFQRRVVSWTSISNGVLPGCGRVTISA